MKRTPLVRKTKLKAKRSTKRRSGRVRDTEYMARVRLLPCLMAGSWCNGAMHAHHAGKRAAGRKADDDTTIPFCAYHHACWHMGAGLFLDWTREERRSWADRAIAETQAKLRHPHTHVEPCPF